MKDVVEPLSTILGPFIHRLATMRSEQTAATVVFIQNRKFHQPGRSPNSCVGVRAQVRAPYVRAHIPVIVASMCFEHVFGHVDHCFVSAFLVTHCVEFSFEMSSLICAIASVAATKSSAFTKSKAFLASDLSRNRSFQMSSLCGVAEVWSSVTHCAEFSFNLSICPCSTLHLERVAKRCLRYPCAQTRWRNDMSRYLCANAVAIRYFAPFMC